MKEAQKTAETAIWLCELIIFWPNISRVKLKSSWIVGESLIASDQQAAWKGWLISSKAQWFFCQCLIQKFIPFWKYVFKKAFCWCDAALSKLLRPSDNLCELIILLIGHLRVQPKSNWIVFQNLIASDQETVWKKG